MAQAVTAAARPPETLEERIAAADREADEARQQFAGVRDRYEAARVVEDHAGAARLKPDLDAARERLAVAEATASGFRTALGSLQAERIEAERAAARDRALRGANDDLAAAVRDDETFVAESRERLAQMETFLAAARAELAGAQEAERQAYGARRRGVQARILLGQYAAPGPDPARPNRTEVLIGQDPVVRELSSWRRYAQ